MRPVVSTTQRHRPVARPRRRPQPISPHCADRKKRLPPPPRRRRSGVGFWLLSSISRCARRSGRKSVCSTGSGSGRGGKSMATETLPDSVKQFISRYIHSLEQLELLLLLQGEPDRLWTVTQVYEVIRSSLSSLQKGLESFAREGFFFEEKGTLPAFRYAPRNEELGASVEQVAASYRRSRVRVIEAIFAPEIDPVQTFADAFKLRKD